MAFTRRNFLKLSGLAPLAGLTFSRLVPADIILEKKQLLKPKALKRGDTIGLVAPGSPIYRTSEFAQMLTDLKALGFELKLGKHVRDRRGYLAGNDKNRASDVMAMFSDSEVDGIICTRGGWGCNRILPLLDFDLIKNNPKVFMGFSDITSLHMAIQKNSGLVTFHGPVGKSVWTDFTTQSFINTIWAAKREVHSIPDKEEDEFTITEGTSQGKLLGGNLSVLVSMIGSGYLPSFKNAILFLEDIGENVYRIDRMLTQLKLAGILDEIAGFVFGKCTDCSAGENSLTLKQVFDDHIKPLQIPAFYGAMISHEDDNITLPVGLKAEINARTKTIRLLETAVN
ncbi:MAG: LD-carboxypeptidase [Balneolaceae bacterium]